MKWYVFAWTDSTASGQTRTFNYNSSDQLQSTSFPETGNTIYTYNAAGQVATKTDAKGQVITYIYDNLNRPSQVKYGATVVRTYNYEEADWGTQVGWHGFPAGRLTSVSYTSGGAVFEEQYQYDRAGSLLAKVIVTPWGNATAGFVLDAQGRQSEVKYPSGTRYQTVYDERSQASRLDKWVDPNANGSGSWVQQLTATYGVAGQMLSMGSQYWSYNNRLQVTGAGGVSYTYDPAANDGKATSATFPSGEVVQYQYDELARLSSANGKIGAVQQWQIDYSFDGFGNLYKKAGTGVATSASFDSSGSLATLAVSNRLGGPFDANGNNTAEGTYDFENRMVYSKFGTYGYMYAPDNKRIVRTGSDGTKLFFYAGNQRLATCTYYQENSPVPPYQLVNKWNCTDEVWFAGRRVGVVDRLGSDVSTRMLPYGEEIGTTASDKVKFATYYRDAGGLDYADQRWYSSTSGRFTSADPYMASGGPADPGSWNRYAYVGGDPVNYDDPQGLAKCYVVGKYWLEDPFAPETTFEVWCTSDGGTVAMQRHFSSTGRLSEQQMQYQADLFGKEVDAEEWRQTKFLLDSASRLIASGVSSDCWDKALSKIIDDNSNNPTRTDLKVASQNVRFTNGLTANPGISGLFAADPDRYAATPYGQSEVFWRPGVVRTSGWLMGAVLHEILHTMGFTDVNIQNTLGLLVGPDTDNISRYLELTCFPTI